METNNPTDTTPAAIPPARLLSLDAYRGFVMLAMASAGLGIPQVAKHFESSDLWQRLAHQFDHVEWRGCAFWDLIQPSFMFIVGVAMPWSYASRREKGASWFEQFGHALKRSAILVVLGVFLASNWSNQTSWIFTNVLAQIGLGYPILFLVMGLGVRAQLAVALGILLFDWSLFAFWPLPSSSADLVAMPSYSTLFQHWTKGANFAADLDAAVLGHLPYPDGSGFKINTGGYTTLNFLPSIATMIFGITAGRLLRSPRTDVEKLRILACAGLVGIALGTAMDYSVCPVIKRLWTPSWTIVSAGWAAVLLAGFYAVIDVLNYKKLAWPLVVVGANSIVMYMMAQLIKPWVKQTLRIHLTTAFYALDHVVGLGPSFTPRVQAQGTLFAGNYGPMFESIAVLGVLWLVCVWLYRQRIFVRI